MFFFLSVVIKINIKLIMKTDLQELYNNLKSIISEDLVVNSTSVVRLCWIAMELAEKNIHLSGSQKKDLVLFLLNSLVDDKVEVVTEKLLLKQIINRVVPALIDTIVDVDKRKMKLKSNKLKRFFCSCNKYLAAHHYSL